MRVAVIHATNNAVQPLNKAFKDLNPSIEIVNFVDENIQGYANKINGIDAKIHRDFFHLAVQSEAADVDIIVVACTVLTPIVGVVKPFIETPIIAVDHLMLTKAVSQYKNIGVVVTNKPTAQATELQLFNKAKELNREIFVHTQVCTEAMTELKQGNEEKHNVLNYEAAKQLLEKNCEVIILAQITQASAQDYVSKLGLPVLVSPKAAMEDIQSIVKQD